MCDTGPTNSIITKYTDSFIYAKEKWSGQESALWFVLGKDREDFSHYSCHTTQQINVTENMRNVQKKESNACLKDNTVKICINHKNSGFKLTLILSTHCHST